MEGKNNSSVARLIGNKLFISLLVLAMVIIVFSAIRSSKTSEIATTVQPAEEEPKEITSETEKPDEVPTYKESEKVVFPEEEDEEEQVEVVRYTMPLSGQLQKSFSEDELIWDETMSDWRTHSGIDIASEEGSEVDTAGPGTVTEVRKDEMYGYVVKVEHTEGVVTIYKNLAGTVVEKGDILDEGQMIGTVGVAAFESAQGPHLHFEVMKDEEFVNPLEFIK